MKNFLQNSRFLLNKCSVAANKTELFRKIYLIVANRFLKQFDQKIISGAWLRRSLVNEDFMPFLSDIDSTILLDHARMKEIFQKGISPYPLMDDIQFISNAFFENWMETGGFRNRQFLQWHPLMMSPKLIPPSVDSPQELAFELAYENHLLFKQLQTKLKISQLTGNESDIFSVKKLLSEFERIRLFWNDKNPNWALLPRKKIPIPKVEEDYFVQLDLFWFDLLNNLHPKLQNYQWSGLIKSEDTLGKVLKVEMEGLPVYLVNHPKDLMQSLKAKPGFFVTTVSYFMLVKGAGLQEQKALNSLSAELPGGFYYKFNQQRLAHDLIGALLLAPKNQTQLYYCFYNIQEFYQSVTATELPGWNEIQRSWEVESKLPYEMNQLQEISIRYLDLLKAMP